MLSRLSYEHFARASRLRYFKWKFWELFFLHSAGMSLDLKGLIEKVINRIIRIEVSK